MSRTSLPNEPPLLDPARALRLAEDARAFFQSKQDWLRADADLAAHVAQDATLLALEVAIDTGDPHVLAAALDIAHEAARTHDHWELDFAYAAEALLPHVHPITQKTRECARSKLAVMRHATAIALAPRALRSMHGEGDDADREAAQIVFALAHDDDGWVRRSTREALGGIAPPAWSPFFGRDPLAGRTAAEAARLRSALDRAAELLEQESDVHELATALAELPDDLAMPMIEAFIHRRYALRADGCEALLQRWVGSDADGERIVRWLAQCKPRPDIRDAERIGTALARHAHAEAVCLRVVRFMVPLESRRDILLLSAAEAIVKGAWPETADPTPILELALGAPLERAAEPDPNPPPEFDLKTSMILKLALSESGVPERMHEPLVDVFLRGFPGRWARAKTVLRAGLRAIFHPRLREHAEAAVRGDTETEVAWSIAYLISGGHSSESDPKEEAILARASLDPRLRAAMIAELSDFSVFAEALRPRLAEGALTPKDAIEVAHALRIRKHIDFRADEWSAVRTAREALTDVVDRAIAVLVLPPLADWTAEDRAYVERLVERHGDHERVADLVSLTLGKHAATEHVPLLERLLERTPPESRRYVKEALAVCRGEKENPWTL